MVDVTVDEIPGKAPIDSCSNLNVITKKFYEKLPGNYEEVGISRGKIRLATKNDEYSEGIIVRIPVKINDYKMIIYFRIIDDDDPFYDLLINFQTQVEHNLFIHPINIIYANLILKG